MIIVIINSSWFVCSFLFVVVLFLNVPVGKKR